MTDSGRFSIRTATSDDVPAVLGFIRELAEFEHLLHEVTTTEVYYMLEGTGTLVTGGTLKDERREPPTTTTVRGSGIDGGVSRKVVPGDVIIIPGRTPHWWSSLDGDIRYMIIRADPDGRIALKP